MIPPAKPDNEAERLDWLQRLDILDSLEEKAYDDLTFLAAQICQVPIALVSLVDRDRQWFKSHHGLAARETPRSLAFCAHAILGDEFFVVEDSARDKRFHDNPLVTGQPHVKFYAGAPLILRDNIRVGTLCVIDNHARTITDYQRLAIEALARQVVSQMELRLKIKELRLLDQAKDEFVSMVSHELRTPLTSVNGSLALLRHTVSNQLEAAANQMLEIAIRNSERLLNLVNDILDIASMEAGKLDLQRRPADLFELAREAVDLSDSYCRKCGCRVTLQRHHPAALTTVLADTKRILQVLVNLISNAAKFTNAEDMIEISVATVEDGVRVGVTDHGKGIAPEELTNLFKKFKQIGGGNAKLPGTGLGLSICKQIIDLHQGRIWCESEPGQRTTFYFTLPLAHQISRM
jgi:signal transduction histidine kinase